MADLGMLSGYQVANRTIGSQAISSGGGPGTGVVGNLSSYTSLSPAPAVVYFLDGVVDVLDSYNTTQFGTDYATCISAFRSAYHNVMIIFAQIQPYSASDTAANPYNAQIVSAVTAAANVKTPLSAVIRNLVISSGLIGYHPHVAESRAWANAMMSEIQTRTQPGGTALLATM